MNVRLLLRCVLLTVFVPGLCSLTRPASAQPTCELPIYAFVTDIGGVGLEGTLDVELRFYSDLAAEAVPVECRTLRDVPVDSGWLRMVVDICSDPGPTDCGAAPLTDLIGSAETLAVGIVVDDAGTELVPRIQVGTAPYAVRSADSGTLDGLGPDAFERDGEIDAHSADSGRHHSATSDGIAITPVSVQVGTTRLDDGALDLGAEADDRLTAEIVQTLTGGGDADVLHVHAAGGGTGGSCYTSWGVPDCYEGWTEVYSGVGLTPDSSASRAISSLYCINDGAVTESSDVGVYYRLLGPVSTGSEGDYRPDAGELLCAVCCR